MPFHIITGSAGWFGSIHGGYGGFGEWSMHVRSSWGSAAVRWACRFGLYHFAILNQSSVATTEWTHLSFFAGWVNHHIGDPLHAPD